MRIHISLDTKAKIINKGLALDIDETLCWTNGFWIEQLQVLFGNPENLSVQEMINKYMYTHRVPYWQTPEILAWMEVQRYSNSAQIKIPLIKNANTFVQKIDDFIPFVFYITTRPKNVVDGTKKWLEMYGFPHREICARPMNISYEKSNKWKAEVLHHLYPEVLGIIDDNPEMIKYLPEKYKGTIFLYGDYGINNNIREDIHIIKCKDWQNVYEKVYVWHEQRTEDHSNA